MSEELLGTARRLVQFSGTRPRQTDLKRAVSTAYYALFHAVARKNADRLIGVGANRADKAWRHAYRALDHTAAFKACGQLRSLRFPAGLIQVGDSFRSLQEARHKADYDPTHRVSRQDALSAIEEAGRGLVALKAASKKDQTAFAAQVLFKTRS